MITIVTTSMMTATTITVTILYASQVLTKKPRAHVGVDASYDDRSHVDTMM